MKTKSQESRSKKNESPAHRTARKVLEIEAQAIHSLIDRLDSSFEQALELILSCKGRVVTTGLGKSGIICRKIAATLASTGTAAHFLHPVEAIHGDLGMVVSGDVVLMLSNSGETDELLALLATIKRLGVPVIAMVGRPESTMARNADCILDVGIDQEACPFGLAPTASTTASLALGDALAIALSERKGFLMEDFARLHPGGILGKKLARVKDLMLAGQRVPRVGAKTSISEVIYEMSRKGLGVTSVVDSENRLLGIISDGDLRRLMQTHGEDALKLSAHDAMTADPVTIDADQLAVAALNLLEKRKITSLMVTAADNRLLGIIHLHHLWGTEII